MRKEPVYPGEIKNKKKKKSRFKLYVELRYSYHCINY